jgi:hypothetical protein
MGTFDFWDHTLQKGNDIEYSLVMGALVAGAVFCLAAIVMRNVSSVSCLFSSSMTSARHRPPELRALFRGALTFREKFGYTTPVGLG